MADELIRASVDENKTTKTEDRVIVFNIPQISDKLSELPKITGTSLLGVAPDKQGLEKYKVIALDPDKTTKHPTTEVEASTHKEAMYKMGYTY